MRFSPFLIFLKSLWYLLVFSKIFQKYLFAGLWSAVPTCGEYMYCFLFLFHLRLNDGDILVCWWISFVFRDFWFTLFSVVVKFVTTAVFLDLILVYMSF